MVSIPELRTKTKNRAAQLGDLVRSLMQDIEPQKERLDPIVAAWCKCVPPGLGEHCCIRGFNRGILQVSVDSPVYMFNLQMCCNDLVIELQRMCPQSGLRNIKLKLA